VALQVKLLRVLQEKQFERLGGHKTISSDVRVIAATNRDLLQAIHTGDFRKDLYYRLNVFPIVVPPLRERPSDIPPLVWFFVRHFCEKMGKHVDSISCSSMNALCNYSWPGNVRELKNIIERAIIITTGKTLQVELPADQIFYTQKKHTLEEIQREHILDILKITDWRIRGTNGAAEILGLKPTTLESRMAKLAIRRPPKNNN